MDILLSLILSLVAAVIPAGGHIWLIWWLDRHEKEPWWLLMLVFLWGAFGATTLSIIVSLILDIPIAALFTGLTYELAGASVVAPVVEEIAKALPIAVIVLVMRREIDSVLDGIVYGAMAGLGFAFVENILYFLGSMEEGVDVWALTVFMRTVIFGLNHAFYSGLVGAGLAYACFARSTPAKFFGPVFGLAAGIFFHAVHNFGATMAAVNCLSLLISLTFGYGGLFLMFVAIVLVWRQERQWIDAHLAPQVGNLLTDEQYKVVRSPFARSMKNLSLLFSGPPGHRKAWRQLGNAAIEFAFKEQQLSHNPDDERNQTTRDTLRQTVKRLSADLSTG